jgi:Xaa-Pro aminopeptidase
MFWNQEKINNHISAAKLLDKIKNKTFLFIKNNNRVTEYQAQNFVLNEFKKNNLKTDRENCIVAFRQNTSFVHYYPSQYCRKIQPNSLIMLDIWARLDKADAPYVDITWMAYKGKNVPADIKKAFSLTIKARDEAVKFVKNNLKNKIMPTGFEVDGMAREVIFEAGYGAKFMHSLGHSIGFDSPHGDLPGLTPGNQKRLQKNIGYTIEPGIYLDNKFGVRSEIDFYIDDNFNFRLSSLMQKEIILL